MLLKDRYQDLDTCLDDYTSWFLDNQTRVVTPESCQHFLELAWDGILFLLHGLRAELVNLRGQRTNVEDLDKAINDFTTWYASNRSTITDVVLFMHFMKKATDDTLYIIHMLRDELRQAQEKEAEGTFLYVPGVLR